MLKGLLVLVGMVVGMVIGGAIASGVFLWLMNQEQQEKQYSLEEKKVVDPCLDLIKCLQKDHMAGAYRLTSASYQKRNDRKSFDAVFGKHQNLLWLLHLEDKHEEHKLTKLPGGEEYEFFYITKSGLVRYNITFTVIQEQQDWRINEIEIGPPR